ncbi:MAG: BamA/TamA family outer membrane protein, partial [Rubricoccaceae bacterium]|nr:BamA/TamA family outer membrane protein [Rubricoccaceae bacterium]
ELYRRRFLPDETADVRLYGLGVNDQFLISGADHAAINVRMIGGSGEDLVVNEGRGSTTYYDTDAGNDVSAAGRTRLELSDDPANNRYEPEDHRHPRTIPGVMPGYSSTDGVVIGASLTFHRPGFRRHPWAFTHHLAASYATGTNGVAGQYRARVYDAFGEEWDAVFDVSGSSAYISYFHGFGNEITIVEPPGSFYHAGLAEVEAGLSVIRRVEQSIEFQVGGGGAYRNVQEDSTRFIDTPAAGLSPDVFDGAFFASGFAALTLNAVDNVVNPRQGFKWSNRLDLHGGINDPASTFLAAGSDLAVFVSPRLDPQLTLAGRLGVGHNFGDFPFYEAQNLSGNSNLRGLRRNRYNGRTVAFQNLEARARMIEKISRTFPITVGILGFVDNGRVWTDGESSSVWHQGYGGGLWFTVLDLSVASATVAQGDDGLQFIFGLDFFY